MNKFLLIFLFPLAFINGNFVYASENLENIETVVDTVDSEESIHAEHQQHHTDTNPLLFIILAVIIGGLTRFLLEKSPVPFTVALLLIGLGLGALGRFDLLHTYMIGDWKMDISFFDKAINWAGHIDPHMLLYVFLPILIFEAAFAMDVHVFKKVATNASILAIPGIVVAMLLTALLMVMIYYFGWGLENWTWEMAMLFGAVISATDPVAVVSILKELGASKKLGTLIEGESLLNDGTAIVIFMVILGGITGTGSDLSPLLIFLKVSFGGVLVGGVIGWFVIRWVKKVFNDMLVEISAIVGAAYLTFFIAENFLGVSGVLALVTFGIIMASVGRTKISPEVQHFLHEFWELAAFLANVLIFLIVGVVIAERIVFTGNDFLILAIVFVGIFIVRAIVIAMFYPAMRKIGYGIDKKDSIVMWWGALRGAIGLALALIVAGTESIPEDIRDQFLFLTAGIVTLTLLINATTIKWLVSKLGMLRVSPAKQAMINNANEYIQQSAELSLERLKKERYLRRSNWKKVKDYLPVAEFSKVDENIGLDFIQESRRRLLEKEKSSYWKQFKEGLLEPEAYQVLVSEINGIIDSEGKKSLSDRQDLEQLLSVSTKGTKFKIPFFSKVFERIFFNRMVISYDSAQGFVDAQEDCIKLLQSMLRSITDPSEIRQLETLQKELEENQIIGMTYLRNFGKEYPEIYNSISTRKSIRTLLNFEKHTIQRLNKNGRITDGEADSLVKGVEIRMKKLRDEKILHDLPSEKEFIGDLAWLSSLGKAAIDDFKKYSQVKNFALDEQVIGKGREQNGVYIVTRGTVEIQQHNKALVIAESGMFGYIADEKSKNENNLTVTALSPVSIVWVPNKEIIQLISKYKEMEKAVWLELSKNIAQLYFSDIEPYNRYSKSKLNREIEKGNIVILQDEEINLFNLDGLLLTGELHFSGGEVSGMQLLSHTKYHSVGKSIIFRM